MNKVLIFGTFDGVHKGHRAMLHEAKALGNYLVVAVAPDAVVTELKGRPPQYTSGERIALLKKEHLADEVVIADSASHSWQILKKHKPSIIALGYDQDELKASLENHLENLAKKPIVIVLSHYDRH